MWIINKLDRSPCRYGYINNIEAYERGFLDDEAKRNPKKTLKKFLEEMDRFDKCLASGGDCTIASGIV